MQVLVKAKFLKGFDNLSTAVIDAVRRSYEGYDDVAVCRLIKDNLGVTGCNDLAASFPCGIRENLVNLPLTEDLKVRVRFI